jgi:dihydropyrimidinase
MARFDLVISGGTVATASDTMRADIGVKDGRVTAIADRLEDAGAILDAAGRLVLPGGVDGHCHFDQPMTDGSRLADDFASGTRSAAAGGTTTIIPFACQLKGRSLRAAVEDYHRRAEAKALVDYAFHLIISDPTVHVLGQELPALIEDGYTSFKVYMTYDDLKLGDRQILDVLAVARRERAMTMIHAENTDAIGWLTDRLLAEGKTAPRYHAAARPPAVEREATQRAITLGELAGVSIVIVHVSSAEAVEQLRWAKARGLAVMAETCPQYLFLTAADLGLDDSFDGARCVCSPPPRDAATQAKLWEALAGGVFSLVSSDHAAFRFDDPRGKLVAGRSAPFTKIPNGIPGVATRLPLLFSGGVQEGRLSLQQFVQLTAANPARLYGLHPRKGTIAVGADADLVLWDTEREVTITNAILHHNCDYTPYEGRRVKGWPVTTLCRGSIVVDDGRIVGAAGHGRFLRCDRIRP